MKQNDLSVSISIDGKRHSTYSGKITIEAKKCFDIVLKNHRNCHAAVFITIDKIAMCKPITLSPKEEKTIYGDTYNNSFTYNASNSRSNMHILEISYVFVTIDRIVKVVRIRDGNDRIPQIPQIPQAPKFPWQDMPIIWAISSNYVPNTGGQYPYTNNLPSTYMGLDGDDYTYTTEEYICDSDLGFDYIRDIVNTIKILMFVTKNDVDDDSNNCQKETDDYAKCSNCGEYNSKNICHCVFCGHRLT